MLVIPLEAHERGLIGQDGWNVLPNGERTPHYDQMAEEWECERNDGGTFLWKHATHCFGHPIGNCNRKLGPYETILCDACVARQDQDGRNQNRLDKRNLLLCTAIEEGALPRWFRAWQRPMLTATQAAALAHIEANEGACVWITGLKGRGKTNLALYVIASCLDRCRTVAYADAPVLHESRQNRPLYNALTTADLLVVDDIEIGNLSQYSVAHIHAILTARHEPRRRTIVTSEKTRTVVEGLFIQACGSVTGGSTLDRLNFPKYDCLQIELTGQNLRRSA